MNYATKFMNYATKFVNYTTKFTNYATKFMNNATKFIYVLLQLIADFGVLKTFTDRIRL